MSLVSFLERERLLKRGAEAELFETAFFGKNALLKKRVAKAYRTRELDEKIRAVRTRIESLLLHKAKEAGVRAPVIFKVDKKNSCILMEFIEGKRAKDALGEKNAKKICCMIGSAAAKLHDAGIIHGDLTTSNIIVLPGGGIAVVDFGLGFFSKKTEDMAVDLLAFKKTFEAAHWRISAGWKWLVGGYCRQSQSGNSVTRQIARVQGRARYS